MLGSNQFMDHFMVFVSVLNKMVTSIHVIYDELEELKHDKQKEIFVNEKSKTINDFKYLLNMIYRDTDIRLLYVVTEITVNMCHIVGTVKRLVNESVLREVATTPTNIRYIANMVLSYHLIENPQMHTPKGVVDVKTVSEIDNIKNNLESEVMSDTEHSTNGSILAVLGLQRACMRVNILVSFI